MFGGVEGWFKTIGYCESSSLGGTSPLLLPYFGDGVFGPAFGVGSGSAEGDLASEGHGLFGKGVGSVVTEYVTMTGAPGD